MLWDSRVKKAMFCHQGPIVSRVRQAINREIMAPKDNRTKEGVAGAQQRGAKAARMWQ